MYFYQRNKTILVRLAENITTAQLTQIPDHYGVFFYFWEGDKYGHEELTGPIFNLIN